MAEVRNRRELVLIDGRSGSGKTSFATTLAQSKALRLLSLDDIYPGWDGLDAGHWRVYQQVIRPWLRGEVGLVSSWDWARGAPGSTIEVDPAVSLVIEGCGALSTFTAPHATSRLWLEADSEVRKKRALTRDGEIYRAHWTRWEIQEDRFYGLHRSPELADTIIST